MGPSAEVRPTARRVVWLITVCALCAGIGKVSAATVKRWSVSTASALAAGTLDGTAIDAEGRVRLAPAVRTLWGPDAGIVWSVAAVDGAAFVGLSGPGRVLRVEGTTDDAAVETLIELGDASLVTALTPARRRGVYVGRSPEGEILHVTGPGEVRSRGTTGATFVWALTTDESGDLWVGTGVPGRVLRNPDVGVMVEVLATDEDPVRCLTAYPGGGVVAGTGGRGRVIRIDARERAFVLYDAEEREIVDVVVDAAGTVYALAAGGPKQVRGASAPRTADNTVTVTATAPPGDDDEGGSRDEEPDDDAAPAVTGTAGGALYRIDPDGAVRRLWSTRTELPFALALGSAEDEAVTLFVATGDQGRIHRVDREGRRASVLRIAANQASALAIDAAGRVFVGGSTDARLETIEPTVGDEGSYTSAPIDAGTVAAWGRLDWQARTPDGAALEFAVRAGNTDEPDATWTDWIELDGDGAGVATRVPPTRLCQVRATLRAGSGASPELQELALSYLPRNRPPVVERLSVGTPGVAWTPGPVPSNPGRGPVVIDDPVAREAADELTKGRRPVQPIRRSYEYGARTFAWKAEDPDGDRLTYGLEIQGVSDGRWLPLADAIEDEFYSWDARAMPDGAYRVRLVASDHVDNPDGASLEHQVVSELFEIDNTRPRIVDLVQRSGGIAFEAVDEGGRVVAVEVAWDGGRWLAVDPLDGVADSTREAYEIAIPQGRRAVMLRVVDAGGNVGGAARALD